MTRKQVLSAPMMRVPLSFDIRFAPAKNCLFYLPCRETMGNGRRLSNKCGRADNKFCRRPPIVSKPPGIDDTREQERQSLEALI